MERASPKDAVVEIHHVPVFAIPYFATAYRGVIQGMCELFCQKAYVKSGVMSKGSGRTGRRLRTMVSGTTVCRAQQAQS